MENERCVRAQGWPIGNRSKSRFPAGAIRYFMRATPPLQALECPAFCLRYRPRGLGIQAAAPVADL